MLEGSKESGPRAGASYLSYLLRIWSLSGEGEAEKWLASVESPLTREQRHFADLGSLFAFLRAMTGQVCPEGNEQLGSDAMRASEGQNNSTAQ